MTRTISLIPLIELATSRRLLPSTNDTFATVTVEPARFAFGEKTIPGSTPPAIGFPFGALSRSSGSQADAEAVIVAASRAAPIIKWRRGR